MDPVVAAGLAAAILQFVAYSVKTLRTCKDIRSSATSATQHNEELERAASFTVKAATFFKDATAASHNEISKLAGECVKDAQALETILKDVRGAGAGGLRSTIKVAWRGFKKKGDLDQLESTLKGKEQRLGTLLSQTSFLNIQDVRLNIDKLDDSQKHDLAQISQSIQDGVKQLQASQAAIRQAMADNQAQTIAALDGVNTSMRQVYVTAVDAELQQKLLRSLEFPDMNARLRSIARPHDGTVKWIFSKDATTYRPQYGPNITLPPSGFVRWLRSDGLIYWICGKPASGKSTMMASMSHGDRIRTELRSWCQPTQLSILSYFFWRPGSPMQKSMAGLLSSLLHQICQQDTNALARLTEAKAARNQWTWSEGELLATLKECLTTLPDRAFAIFIDGLDEFEGKYLKVTELLETLRNICAPGMKLKMCVASRPENVLAHMLELYPHVKMEKYNEQDIRRYVDDKLSSVTDPARNRTRCRSGTSALARCEFEELNDAIVWGSNGVFLWTVLMISEVIEGLQCGYQLEKLLKILDSTPQDIDELIRQQLCRLSKVHLDSARFYFGIMLQKDALRDVSSIPIITAARSQQSLESPKDFINECATTVKELKTHTAGLIETQSVYDDVKQYHLEHELVYWCAPAWASGAEDKKRVIIDKSTVKSTVWPYLQYDGMNPEWIHRSAYDVVREWCHELLLQHVKSTDDSARRCVEGAIRHMLFAPSWTRVKGSQLGDCRSASRLSGILSAVQHVSRDDTASQEELCKQLYGHMTLFADKEMLCAGLPFTIEQSSPALCLADGIFKHRLGSLKMRDVLERNILAESKTPAAVSAWATLRLRCLAREVVQYTRDGQDVQSLLQEYNATIARMWQKANIALSEQLAITTQATSSTNALPSAILLYVRSPGDLFNSDRCAVLDAVDEKGYSANKHALANVLFVVTYLIELNFSLSGHLPRSVDTKGFLQQVRGLIGSIVEPMERLGLMLDCKGFGQYSRASALFSILMPPKELLALEHLASYRRFGPRHDIFEWCDTDAMDSQNEDARSEMDDQVEIQVSCDLPSTGLLWLVFQPVTSEDWEEDEDWDESEDSEESEDEIMFSSWPPAEGFYLRITERAIHILRALAACVSDESAGGEANENRLKDILLHEVAAAGDILTPTQQITAQHCIEHGLSQMLTRPG